MLLSFSIENYKGIKEEVVFSTICNPKIKTPKESIAPTLKMGKKQTINGLSMIWGPNGGGKSTLFDALLIMKKLLDRDDDFWDYNPHWSDETSSEPTKIKFEISIDGDTFYFELAYNDSRITKETLDVERKNTYRKENIYARSFDDVVCNVRCGWPFFEEPQSLFLKCFSLGGLKGGNDLIQWFKDINVIKTGNATNEIVKFYSKEENRNLASETLKKLDIGISKIDIEDFDFNHLEALRPDLNINIINRSSSGLLIGRDIFFIEKKSKTITAKRVVYYTDKGDQNIKVPGRSLPEGAINLLHLLPVIFFLQDGKTVLIDGIEQGLHTNIVEELIRLYAKTIGANFEEKNTSGQLISITHDTNLLDTKHIRIDAKWICSRVNRAVSLKPISKLNFKGEKNLNKKYLENRFCSLPSLES